MKIAIALAASFFLSACATIVEGTSQIITVDVSPASGVCQISRQGERLGTSSPQNRRVNIGKSQHDLVFACSAPGFQSKTDTLSSDLSAATVGSFFLLDLGIVDAATGAWHKYPNRILITLAPIGGQPY